MAFCAGSRVDPSFNAVAAQVIAAMRQVTFRGSLVFIAGLELLFVGMAIRAEGFAMARGTDSSLSHGVVLMLAVEIISLVVQGDELILVALAAVDKPLDFLRVLPGETGAVGTGINNQSHYNYSYKGKQFFLHLAPPSAPNVLSKE